MKRAGNYANARSGHQSTHSIWTDANCHFGENAKTNPAMGVAGLGVAREALGLEEFGASHLHDMRRAASCLSKIDQF
jgi:hypothetical protein